MDSSTLAAIVPTIAAAVVGWLLKRLIADLSTAIEGLRGELKELRGLVGAHQSDLGRLDVRVQVLEHEVEKLRDRAA